MKRRLTKFIVFLLLGAIVNVAVAWGFAIWPSYRYDWTHYFSHGSGRQWNVRVFNGIGATRVGRVPNNGRWGVVDGTTTNREVIPYWSIARDRPPAAVFDDPTMPWHVEYAYGWPLRAGCAEAWRAIKLQSGKDNPSNRFSLRTGIEVFDDGSGQPMPFRTLPVRPILPGFAINTVFYAAILWLLTFGPFTARRIIRRKRGLCIKCGYDLRETPDKCPECGWGREAEEAV